MFIWRGFGIAVLVLTFGALLVTQLGVGWAFSDQNYYQAHGWPKFLGFLLAAALIWLLSQHLEKRPKRVVIDKSSGQELIMGNKHDFFFVPLRYWPAILVVAGFVLMFAE